MREVCPSSVRKPLIFFITLLLTTPMIAFAGNEIVEVFVGPDKIVFEPLVENEGFTLSFGDECEIKSWKFGRGDTPVLYAYDNEGKPLHDGSYTWELHSRPVVDPEIAELLHKSRKYNDTQLPIDLKREGLLPEGRSQTGYIIIIDGKFVDVREQEDNAKADDVLPDKDFVILDDLIVDGSACIGFDCVNGESFGFDTIRLKENNLRIKFDDTSVAASFPRTDWQLTANDSANGGASKFSIDDISGGRTPFTVEANAPSHSLYVDDGGRVGFGTSTPVADLHVISGDSPTLRLEQNGSSGFAPQTWDVAGNETNFFVRDASNGSTLPFRIRPGAPTSSIHIDEEGDVGVGGTASPDSDLHVIGNLMVAEADSGQTPAELMEIESSSDNGARIRFDDTHQWNAGGGAGNTFVILEASDAAEFVLNSAGDLTILGTLTENSDVNAKENFARVDAQEVLSKVLDLPVTTWNYRDNSEEIRHVGPMAQDFYAAFGLGGTDHGIAPRNLAGVALVAIQGLNEELEEKNTQISNLEEQNAALTDRLTALEAMVQALAAQQ